jgi:lysozyme
MARNVNAEGLKLIKQWEGLRLKAYKDGGGVWTIGYGHTSAAGNPKVNPSMSITEAEAEKILRDDLDKFEADVVRLVKVPLTDNQFSALVSFHFNTGALDKSTLLKKLNKGDYNSVPSELMKWVNDNGKKVQGLVNRRAAECGLWAKGSYVSTNTQPVEKVKPPIVTKENITWVVSILSALGLSQVSGPIAIALAVILVGAAAIGAYFFIKSRKDA